LKYYRLINDSNVYYSLTPQESYPAGWRSQFDGKKFGDGWQPLKMKFDDSDNNLLFGDFPHFAAYLPGLSERAWNTLKPFINEYVEPLQVDVYLEKSITKYYLLNVICILDALDKIKSDILYFDADHIMDIDHYVFNGKNIGKIPIFRIRNDELGGIYVNDIIRDCVENNQLKGFSWEDLP